MGTRKWQAPNCQAVFSLKSKLLVPHEDDTLTGHMANGRIRVLRAIPGSLSLGTILRDYSRKGDGIVTAFSDSLLPVFRQELGDGSPIEVSSFSDVVRSFLILCGEEVLNLCQSGHKKAAIAYACGEVDIHSPFYASSKFAGFHEALGQTLDELHMWGLTSDEMEGLATLAQPRLALKLKDLAVIDRKVSSVLDQLGRHQHSHQILSCLGSTLELDGDSSRLLVFAGAEECPMRIDWLKWAADQGIEVTVVVDRHATYADIFTGARRIVEQIGVPPDQLGPMNRLLRNLFKDHFEEDDAVEVSIISAADPLAEVEWAIRGCMVDGDPSRCGIYVRDLESYSPLLESVAKRLGVPIRMARRAPLLTNSFARLTLGALRFCASNDVRTLSSVLHSSYLRLPGKAQNELEGQLRICYAAREAQWTTLEAWAVENAETHAWLVAILEWRRRATEGGLKLPEWYALLQEFNRDQRLPWARLENKGGAMDERDRRALNQLERILANTISVDIVTESSSMTIGAFVQLCERLWTEGDVSIPTSEDGIRVAADPTVFGDIDRLHVLGMLEGVFPRRRSEDPILTDAERAEISAMREGQPALPNSHDKAKAERDEFYRVCAAGKKAIVFSYPLADDQKDNIPAFYLTEAQRASGGEDRVYLHNYPRLEFAPSPAECVSAADVKLRAAMDGDRELPLSIEIVTEEAKQALLPIEGRAYQPNVLRDAFQCPFQYLVRHVLKLRVKRQSERWSALRKLPQAAQLLSKKDLTDAERALQLALQVELDRLYSEVPDWEMQLLRAGGERLIRDWLDRESVSRREWQKDAGSIHANVAFGTHGINNQMPHGVKLEGAIAGVSRLENYNVAHLYGASLSGGREISETEQLYYGLHLLAIYEPGRDGAIELETMSGKRTLMVMGRGGSRALASSVEDGLQVIDLAKSEDLTVAKKEFYTKVKSLLEVASQRIREGKVEAIKGEHCDVCDFGELCRRSKTFGEDDSPFGVDLERDDE